jgi:prevent-host-death family protein
MHEAKTQLSKLVDEAMSGEQIIIAKAGTPMVVLQPYMERVTQRKGGQLAGKIIEEPGCWDADELGESIDAPGYSTPSGGGSMRVADGAAE